MRALAFESLIPSSKVIPALVQTKYDFDDNGGLDASVSAPGISNNRYVAAKWMISLRYQRGYEDEVYSQKSNYLVSIGVGFDANYKIEDLVSVKLRLCVQSDTPLSKGNFRLYDDKENAIRADDKFSTLSVVYNEWLDIDLLPLVKAYEGFDLNGFLQKFCVVVRAGVEATVSFDSVTVTSTENKLFELSFL